jgi:hypothetical protein
MIAWLEKVFAMLVEAVGVRAAGGEAHMEARWLPRLAVEPRFSRLIAVDPCSLTSRSLLFPSGKRSPTLFAYRHQSLTQ